MYFLLGFSITLALLLIANIGAASLSTLVWRLISRSVSNISVATAAQVIFVLRVFPVAVSAVLVSVFVVPAYVMDEPADSGEVVSVKLAMLAAASFGAVLIATFRVVRSWYATRSLASNWLRNGELMSIASVHAPIYRIDHEFPVIAVLGIFRPRLFVAGKVLDSLNKDEIAAALAHECGHLAARDNLKRTVLRICRDLVLVPVGRTLDNAWMQNVEAVADEYAAATGKGIALDLASALIKIARIVPENSTPALPAGAYLIDGLDADITSRVRRLVRFNDTTSRLAARDLFGISPLMLCGAIILLLTAFLPFINSAILASTHDAIESFVSLVR